MFAGLFEPEISWFYYLSSTFLYGYSVHTNNLWYLLLLIPIIMIDRILFHHYYGDDDE